MDVLGIWEAAMLLCFGASWPMAILKTLRAKDPKGKSFFFMGLILVGYICGIIGKLNNYGLEALSSVVFWLYIINTLMVATDLLLCTWYCRKNRQK